MNGNPLVPARLVAYAAPAVPLAMLLFPIYIYLPPFYAAEMGMSLTTVGTIFFLARMWDGVIDPVIGSLSDRWRTRWGRRKPWIVAGAPCLMISTYFLCMPASGRGAVYLFTWLMLFYVAWTVIFIPYYSWGAELSRDYRERNTITGFREAGTMIGILLATGLPLLLLEEKPDLRAVLAVFAVSTFVLFPLTIGLATRVVNEAKTARTETATLAKSFQALAANKPYQRFLLAMAMILLGSAFFDSTIVFVITHKMNLPGEYLTMVFVSYVVALMVAPAIVRLGRKIDKHWILAFGCVVYAIGYLSMTVTAEGNQLELMGVFVVLGLASSILRIYPGSLIADVVDFDTASSGDRQAGLYFSVYNLVYKFVFALGVGIAYPLLDLGGFDADGGEGDHGLQMLMIVGLVLPAILNLLAVAVLWRYPITSQRHELIKQAIERRELQKQGEAP
jgi:Na+/melibiose symporter-like transporter